MSLYGMDQRRPAANGRGHVHGFRDVLQAHPFFQAGFGIRINAVWTLDDVGNGNAYQHLLSFGEFPRFKRGRVPVDKLFEKRRVSAHVSEAVKVFAL
jgi:hypothetical protein